MARTQHSICGYPDWRCVDWHSNRRVTGSIDRFCSFDATFFLQRSEEEIPGIGSADIREVALNCEKGSTGTLLHRATHQIDKTAKQDIPLMEIALLGKGCSDRNAGKRRRLDGHGDRSDRMSDGARDQIKDRNLGSSESKMQVDDQIRDIYSEIMLLENDKQQLQKYLEDKVKEADSLTLEIHELKMQLSKEKEEGKRVTAKIKEYTEAHNYHLRLQDERKRSLAELQNLGEQLDLDVKGSAFTLSDDDEGEPDSSSRRLWSPVEAQETSPQDERFRARVGPSNGAGGSEDTLNTSRSPFSPPRTVQRQQRERGR
ncbi:zinc finger CCCH domain-containing protein 13-like isoform X4 [Salvia divinorum]|uniref:Zinc finger CCCH domain-containing protein 13-like isoform X4 n=1 Tax=Salvia divinorum TaxID=28513 RepID=A0ABD1HH32_SALDI